MNSSNDSGLSTLRNAVFCVDSNATIVIDPTMLNDAIEITSAPIGISMNLKITSLDTIPFMIEPNSNVPLFSISTTGQMQLSNAHFTGGTAATDSAIVNQGALIISNAQIMYGANADPNASLISNEGGAVLEVQGNVEVKKH